MIIRIGIEFEYDPEQDEFVREEKMSEAEMIDYYKSCYIDDIYNFVKYNELSDAVEVQVIKQEFFAEGVEG